MEWRTSAKMVQFGNTITHSLQLHAAAKGGMTNQFAEPLTSPEGKEVLLELGGKGDGQIVY